jgi:hypothetical protein
MSVSINTPLNDVLQTVERPVVFNVVRALMNLTQISSKTQIRFYGEDGNAAQYNSTLTKDEESDNLWPHTPNLTIEVEEDHDPDNLINMVVKSPENRYVFWDEDLNVVIRPVYSPTLVVVRMLYKAVDKNAATKWRNDMRTRTAKMSDMYMHTINYSWHVPDEYLVILKEIWQLTENIAGEGLTFADWMTQRLSSKATQTANLSGVDSFLAIAEQQMGVQGWFDYEGVPEKATRDDEPNLWVTSVSYKFRYDKPIESVIDYPLIVHQQVLDAKYRPTNNPYSYQGILKQFNYSGEKFYKFSAENQKMQYLGNRGLSIPPFDNCVLNSSPVATVRAFLALIQLSEADKRSMLNLGQLGDFNICPDILAFMKASEYQYMTTPYASVFQLHMYQDRRIQEQDTIVCDGNLNVSLVADADLKITYRLRLSLVATFAYLTDAAVARLRSNTAAAIRVCNAINASIRDISNHTDIFKSRLTVEELRLLNLRYDQDFNIIPMWTAIGPDPNRIIPGGLVENLFIVAERTQR